MLRWAYLRQCVIVETGRALEDIERKSEVEYEPHRSTTDGTVTMERLSIVGTFVDGGGPKAASSRYHPDAGALHDLVCTLPVHLRKTLISHVMADTVPEPYAGHVEWRAVQSDDPGRYRYQTDGNWVVVPRPRTYGKTAKTTVRQGNFLFELYDDCARVFSPFCPVVQEPDAGWIERRAQQAVEFRAALDDLFEMVCGTEFQSYVVIGSGI